MKCPNCLIELKKNALDYVECPECKFTTHPNAKLIEELYAWVSVDPVTNLEGLLAFYDAPNNCYMAAVNSDRLLSQRLRPIVKKAKNTGMKIKLVKFTMSEVIEEL